MEIKPSLKLFNTLSRQKEVIEPMQGNCFKVYTCGPTVYNFAHIGNFRTYIFEDLLRRTIKFLGFEILQVMNLTDVDDKTINGAIEKDVSLKEYVAPYIQAFFADLDTLRIERVEHYPAATDHIQEMIDMIQQLIDKNVAYRGADGSIYFSIQKFPHYGCLSHLKLDELKSGASERVASDEYDKENAADFVLWKAYDPVRDGKIYWESPYGKGRPGWHLECSVMAIKMLGESIDIHCGGIDNMFPHHENEIAQSEACSGKKFSNCWLHAEHLVVDGKKMSKSLGNFYTLRNLLEKGFSGKQVRYLLLQTHYKTQLNFTFEGLEAAKHSLQRLEDFALRMMHITTGTDTGEVIAILDHALENFSLCIADDLNISPALAAIFEMIREVNFLCDAGKVGPADAKRVIDALQRFDTILNVISFEKIEEQIPQEVEEALRRRIEARKNKDWAAADQLRDFICEQGFVIEDTPAGIIVKRKDM